MQHLILLHGAIGSKEQLEPLAQLLQNDFTVHTIGFAGHGGNPVPDEPFSIELFAHEVLDYMQQQNIEQSNIFGYSMGGYVGLYLAKKYADKIIKLVTLATKVQWNESIAAKEIKMMDADTIQQKVPAFAAQLEKRHAPNNWKTVLQKGAEMLANLGRRNTLILEDYSTINTPCLLLLGDRDKMVSLDETVTVYKQLSIAQFAVLPNTAHPIEQVDASLLAFIVKRFLKQ